MTQIDIHNRSVCFIEGISRPISFGISADELEGLMGKPEDLSKILLVYPKARKQLLECMYKSGNILFSFENGALNLMEVLRGNGVSLKGGLLPDKLDELLPVLKELNKADCFVYDEGYYFLNVGVYVYCPSGNLHTIGFFAPGYYETLVKNDQYKIRNSRMENGILTYYFDYKDEK